MDSVLRMMGVGLATVMILSSVPVSAHAENATPIPAWAGPLSSDLDRPDKLSAEGQQTCETRVLDELNRQFSLKLDDRNVGPVQAPSWPTPLRGFIRGGGYNLRILVDGLKESEIPKLKPNRFEGDKHGHADSLVSSLHIPGVVDGSQTFFKTVDPATGLVSLDFTAHIDSAYAYSLFGLFGHFFEDVLGADSRDPCPDTSDQ